MNWLERLADRIHAQADAEAEAQGLVVTRLPGGRRRVNDPRLAAFLEARRQQLSTKGTSHDDEPVPA